MSGSTHNYLGPELQDMRFDIYFCVLLRNFETLGRERERVCVNSWGYARPWKEEAELDKNRAQQGHPIAES